MQTIKLCMLMRYVTLPIFQKVSRDFSYPVSLYHSILILFLTSVARDGLALQLDCVQLHTMTHYATVIPQASSALDNF